MKIDKNTRRALRQQRCGKTNYATQAFAERVAFTIHVQGKAAPRAYKCDRCDFWHLSHLTADEWDERTRLTATATK